jgi:hypothetical protein
MPATKMFFRNSVPSFDQDILGLARPSAARRHGHDCEIQVRTRRYPLGQRRFIRPRTLVAPPSGWYRRIAIHGLTIRMLTTDTFIGSTVDTVTAALRAQQNAYIVCLTIPTIRQLNWEFLRQQLSPADKVMEHAERQLLTYCETQLGVVLPSNPQRPR